MRRDKLKAIVQKMKKQGRSAKEVWDLIHTTRRETAQENNWRQSELAMALGGDRMMLEEVYGKDATAGLFD